MPGIVLPYTNVCLVLFAREDKQATRTYNVTRVQFKYLALVAKYRHGQI